MTVVHKLKSTAILYLNMSVITSALEMLKAHNFLSHALEGVVKQISKNLSLSGVQLIQPGPRNVFCIHCSSITLVQFESEMIYKSLLRN